MWPFGCKHEADWLCVDRKPTVTKIDDDFERITYHLWCMKCERHVDISHASCIGGVPAFMKRGAVTPNR